MASAIHEAEDFLAAVDYCHAKGWTDGLPVIPPTPDLVARFVETVDLPGDAEVGFYTLRNRPVTVEKLAINAVMAGCKPEYFPVVLALVECLLEPGLELHTAGSSTGNIALGYVVNGPVRHKLEMNFHGNLLGPGNRANAAIGRALRLIQVNVCGSVPGAGGEGQGGRPILDRATMGNPLRYASFHVVENEEAFPRLTPLHVMRGFAAGDSVVTAFALFNYLMLSNHFEKTPEAWIESVAHYVVGAAGWRTAVSGCCWCRQRQRGCLSRRAGRKRTSPKRCGNAGGAAPPGSSRTAGRSAAASSAAPGWRQATRN